MKYEFKDGPLPFKNIQRAGPQAIGEAIERARRAVKRKEAAGEKISREETLPKVIHADVVREGDKHPMHASLEWNDKRGAYLHRLDQIRGIIGVIRIVNETDGQQKRAFVGGLRLEPGGPSGYRSSGEIIKSISLQIATLRRAEKDLEAFESRYSQLAELCAGATALRQKARAMREDMEERAAAGEDVSEPERARA